MHQRPADPDALRYARHWEPLLAGPARRALARIDAEPAVFLDVGAGTGGLIAAAAERWPRARIVALDAAAAMLSVGQRRLARERPADLDRFEWLVADALDMPLEDGSIDAVLSSFVLSLVEDRPALLAEMRRVLRPGGSLSIVTWLTDELVVGADAVLDELVRETSLAGPQDPVRPSRADDYRTADELAEELAVAGYRDIELISDELHHAWSREGYLELKQHYDERDLFESLEGAERDALLDDLMRRWDTLPDAAFELHAPLLAATARRPSA